MGVFWVVQSVLCHSGGYTFVRLCHENYITIVIPIRRELNGYDERECIFYIKEGIRYVSRSIYFSILPGSSRHLGLSN